MPAAAEPEASRLTRDAVRRGQAALAAEDRDTAERWFARAHRLLPNDLNLVLRLATVQLGRNDAEAARLFRRAAEEADLLEAWLGLAAASLRLGSPLAAADALAAGLSRHAPGRHAAAVADAVARAADAAGWCGLNGDGSVAVRGTTSATLRLDGHICRDRRLPPGWDIARSLSVTIGDRHLLGSPIDVTAIRRLEGCVAAEDGGLVGWAWHPGDPDTDPVLRVIAADGQERQFVASDLSVAIDDAGPLARQRRFHFPASALSDLTTPLQVRGPDGQALFGSPLDPLADMRMALHAAMLTSRLYATATPPVTQDAEAPTMAVAPTASPDSAASGGLAHAAAPVMLADAAPPATPIGADPQPRLADVVIPIRDNRILALACLDSVLRSVAPPHRIVVIDDGSRDPQLVASLDKLAADGLVTLVRHAQACGFPASANAGIAACAGNDVVLLNSDTLVPPDWLSRLTAAAYSAAAIGTVTPLSNNATILTYAGAATDDAMPDQVATTALDRLAQRANGAATVEIPVGVGFCLYLRRDCLDAVGLLRADVFAQGYGEENDFCLRARHLGWQNVALPGLFVAHGKGGSFGSAGQHLRARNARLLNRLHPGHDALIAAYTAQDPLFPYRRRLDEARWRAARPRSGSAAILITHNDGGGVERCVQESARAHQAAGRRAIVLRPAPLPDGSAGVQVCDGGRREYPDLLYRLPAEITVLLRLLRSERPARVEVHHLLDHAPEIHQVVTRLAVPYDVHVHDYPWFCGRISLVGVGDRYCGEPDVRGCEDCLADTGPLIGGMQSPAELRAQSARFLADAARVITPSTDAATRMRRHFPMLRPQVVPHGDDAAIPSPGPPMPRDGRCLVCLSGAIGVHKGYDVLLACARDAARRNLKLDFVVVGKSIDDARLLATGRVFLTGGYRPEEAVALIRSQRASLGLLPSIWPETWSFGLTELWQAGLQVAAFDLGAPAERIRNTGYGLVLPFGLSPAAVNNALVASVGLT